MKKLVTIILVFLLASCTTVKYVEVPSIQRDTIIHNNTLIQKDTVYQSEKIITVNDTVYVTQYKFRERTVFKEKTDTVIRTDSIPYPVPTPVEKIVYKKVVPGWCWLILSLTVLGIGAFLHRKLKGVRDALR